MSEANKLVLLMRKGWTEGKHPRDGAGRFAPAPGANPSGGNDRKGGESTKPPLITGITPLTVNSRNYGEQAKREFKKLEKKIKEGLFCPALEGRRVAGFLKKHLKESNGKKRPIEETIKRVSLMPYIIPVIEHGITESRTNEKGNSFRVYGKTGTGKEVSVILIEDKKTRLLYFSVFDNEKVMNKSLAHSRGQYHGGASWFPSSPIGLETPSPSLNFIIPDISEKSIEKKPGGSVFRLLKRYLEKGEKE